MIPAAFEYHAPKSIPEALKLLTSLPDAKLLAGGHSLLPMMKLRLVSPPHVIDLGRIQGLREIKDAGSVLSIGALATHWMIESSPVVKSRVPVLAETASRIGDIQVRNLGTIGGSLVHSDPASDHPATALALECEFVAESPKGRRTIRAADFFTGIFSTALRPDEILVEVRVPVPADRTGSAYLKFPHPASGFAVVGVAAAVTLDGGNVCKQARIGITGVGPMGYRPKATETLLTGKPLTDESIETAAQKADEGIEANQDIFATADYRRHLARVYTKRAIKAAKERVKT